MNDEINIKLIKHSTFKSDMMCIVFLKLILL